MLEILTKSCYNPLKNNLLPKRAKWLPVQNAVLKIPLKTGKTKIFMQRMPPSKESWELVDKFFLDKISSAGISRVTGISEVWIQRYVNKKYEEIQKKVEEVFKKVV